MKKILVILFLIPVLLQGALAEKVLILGICRNVEERLPSTTKIMESMGELFTDYKILVYENNSKDQTKKFLKGWSKRNKNVTVWSEDVKFSTLDRFIVNRNLDGSFFRPEEISRARNILLEKALSKKYKEYTHIIWMDMDFKIPPRLEGVIEVFQSPKEWDAVFAYGIDPPGTYWDWYAFRDANYPFGSELLGNDWWYMNKTFHLTKEDDWYPVFSAFGGCGIYKKSSIEDCRYSALVTADLEKLSKHLLETFEAQGHVQAIKYYESIKKLHGVIQLDRPRSHLKQFQEPNIGYLLSEPNASVIWRMSTFVYQYPSVCEHVPFHASMIIKGHGKLYINPRLVFTYGG